MTWQEFTERSRTIIATVRSRLSWRRATVAMLLVGLVAFVAAFVEAAVRAELPTAESRIPTSLYTRQVAWDPSMESARPVVIGTLNGDMLEERVPVTLERVPSRLVNAVLAIEDQRFREHDGLDFRRIGGAMVANVRAGGIAQGGSTITQQLAKNLFLSADRTPVRKLREAAIALVLEMRHDKPAILAAYLNEIYLGQDGGRAIHGVGAASRFYFGKDVSRLTLAESALLAGMIHAPNRTAPVRNPNTARDRRNLVLDLMAEQGRITAADAKRAKSARIPSKTHSTRSIDARHLRDYAVALAPRRLPKRGAAVYTTIDASLQRAAEAAVASGLARLRAPGLEAALVAIDPRTGEVLAMVGGRDYGASQFNRAVAAHRQPGSAFKPVVALAALERNGDDDPAFTLASVVDDEPIRVETASGPWIPTNYDRGFRGPVTVRRAMEQSLNIPFVRIGLAIGPESIVATARRLGITSTLTPVPSIALGSSEVTLVELVRAYGVLAAGGRLAPTRVIDGHRKAGAPFVRTAITPPQPVIDPATSYLVTSMLQGVVSNGTASALGARGFEGDVAGKTGTSNNWRDAWFIAYTPNIVVGVWMGYDDGRSSRLTGGAGALPIAARFLADAQPGAVATFEMPEGVTQARVGGSGGWFDDCGERELFLEGTEPEDRGCIEFELPEWVPDGEWGEELRRQAERFLEGVVRSRGTRR